MRDSLVSMVDGGFSNSRPYVSTLGIAGTVADGYPRCGKEFTCRKYIEKKKETTMNPITLEALMVLLHFGSKTTV